MYNSGIDFFFFEKFIPVAQKVINVNNLLADFLGLCKTILKKKFWRSENGKEKKDSNERKYLRASHRSNLNIRILCLSTIYNAPYQARLQQYVNRELPDVQAGFRKGRGTRDQIANIHCIMKKARKF